MSTALEITFVLGAPGSGKGTLCAKLAAKENSYHLSVGDYLRELRKAGDQDLHGDSLSNKDLRQYLDKGELVPAKDIVAIISEKISKEQQSGQQKFLIDGFPRDLESAQRYDAVAAVRRVLFFDCPKQVALQRLVGRGRDEKDDADVFEKRYAEFERNNPAILKHYADRVIKIDTGGEIEQSWPKLLAALRDKQKGQARGDKEAWW